MRSLRPLTEEEIIKLIGEQDRLRDITPRMSLNEFLLALYTIVPLGYAICNAKQAAEIMNLRVEREGIEKGRLYNEYSVRQKVFTGRHSKLSMEEEQSRPEGTAALYPLSDEEETAIFGAPVENQHWFLVSDVLEVRLTKHKLPKPKAEKKPRKKTGRPTVREQREKKHGKVGRPPSTTKGKIKAFTQELAEFQRKNDLKGVNETIQKLAEVQGIEAPLPEG